MIRIFILPPSQTTAPVLGRRGSQVIIIDTEETGHQDPPARANIDHQEQMTRARILMVVAAREVVQIVQRAARVRSENRTTSPSPETCLGVDVGAMDVCETVNSEQK